MKRIRLLFDILNEVEKDKQIGRKVIIAVSGAKFLIDHEEEYLAKEYNWHNATLNKNCIRELFNELYEDTSEDIFTDADVHKVLDSISDELFEKIIGKIDALENDISKTELVEEYRRLANVDPKLRSFTTPDSVLDVVIEMLQIKKGSKIVDSFNGESGTLLAINKVIGEDVEYYGQELLADSYIIGSFIAFILLKGKAVIKQGDSFKEPIWLNDGHIEKYDYAISVPPFIRSKQEINEHIANAYKGINLDNSKSDWLPILEGLISINDQGKAAYLVPNGILFAHMSSDIAIKKYLLTNDYLEAIVKLPERILAPYTSIQTHWLIFNKNKDASRKNKIRYIKLDKYIEDIDRRSRAISNEGIKFAANEYKEMISDTEDSFDLNIIDIIENNYNLDGFECRKKKELAANIRAGKIIPLKSIAMIRRGVQLNKNRLDVLNNEKNRSHYVVSLGNIYNGKIVLDEASKIGVEDRWIDLYQLQEGDIVLTSKGSSFKTALVDESIKNAIISANLSFIRVNRDKYDPVVLKYYLDSEQGREIIETLLKGSTTIRSLSTKDLEGLMIPNIDLEKQEKLKWKIIKSRNEYLASISYAEDVYEQKLKEINEEMNMR